MSIAGSDDSEASGPDCEVQALCPLKGPIRTEISVPGSKSYTIRALLLAALTPKTESRPLIRVINPLFSDDTHAVIRCLETLGIRLEMKQDADAHWIEVSGGLEDIADGEYLLSADLSAATLRFMLALSAVIPGSQTLLGREGLNRRPVRDLVDSLRALGASVTYLDREGYPPVRVSSTQLQADTISICGGASSQYVSALMMAAPLVKPLNPSAPLAIELPDEPISRPYLEMTMAIMMAFGVPVTAESSRRFVIPRGRFYSADAYTVEPDASSMAYFLAIAALTQSEIAIPNVRPDSAQADMRFVEILRRMGNHAEYHGDKLILRGTGVRPLHVDMRDCPDQAQTLAVLAAFADGTTRIDGLQSLRIKETDRIAAVVRELERMGVSTEEEPDALVIHGGNPKAASIATYGDHRMAMAFAVAGAALPGMAIEDPSVVNKTYPTFWNDLQRLGMIPDEPASVCKTVAASVGKAAGQPDKTTSDNPAGLKIVLIGFMGAGKSAVAAVIAEKLGLESVEMDGCIVQRSGRNSINAIFENDGEHRFRELEMETARALQDKTNVVISTGGGVVMNNLTMYYLSGNAHVVFLDAQWETLQERLADSGDRPLWQTPEAAHALYHLRLPLYRHYARVCMTVDQRSPERLASDIIRAVAPDATSLCAV